MPPKPKLTREEVIAAGLELVSKGGAEALTARDLGRKLGTSASPIFTTFKNMEEVKREVRSAALECFNENLRAAIAYTPAYKEVGIQVVKFAKEQPNLFKLLFMTEGVDEAQSGDNFGNKAMVEQCIRLIRHDYELDEKRAMALFGHVWIYTFGISAMCATKACDYSQAEVNQMLSEAFFGFMQLVKSDVFGNDMNIPVKDSSKENSNLNIMWESLS